MMAHSLVAQRASPGAQMVKNPPARQETWVQSLDWEDPLETGDPTSCLERRGAGQATVPGITKRQTQLSNLHLHFFLSV